MQNKTEQIFSPYLKADLPDIKVGDTVRLHQKIILSPTEKTGKKKEVERVQVFEGVVIAKKHGRGLDGSITVRKIIEGVGVEKVVPLHSPNLIKIEVLSHGRVRRAKLYYLRKERGKRAKIKTKEFLTSSVAPGAHITPNSDAQAFQTDNSGDADNASSN